MQASNPDFGDDYIAWLRHGLIKRWISPPACYSHDGVGMLPEEEIQFEDGGDPCIWLIRVYEDQDMAKELEGYHAPYSWRRLEYLHNDDLQ